MPPIPRRRVVRRKTRVFVSFDYDKDRVLRDFVIGQAKLTDSPFHVANWSMKEAAPLVTWELEAERRIARSQVVLVMVGRSTYRASGVLKESPSRAHLASRSAR
jgi:hypothetical protein